MVSPAPSAAPSPPAAAVPLTTVPVGARATLHEVTDLDSRAVLRSLGLTDACVLRLCQVGDRLLIMAFASLTEAEARAHAPRVVFVGEGNTVEQVLGGARP